MKKILILSAALLTACATDPYSGESKISNTGKGAGIGAAVGAGAGTLFGGNDLKNAGFGALAGAAVGAAVGYYMDRQEKEMQQSLQGTDIQVQRTAENTLNLTMPSGVTFGYDSSALTPQAQTALDSVAKVLNHYPESTITIAGHTDDSGSDTYNQKLSEERAASVSTYLSQHNVTYNRLSTKGMGEGSPKLPNTSEANRAENRRVELAIIANNNAGGQPQNAPQQQPGYQQQGQPQPGYQQQRQPQQGYQQQQGYPQQDGNYLQPNNNLQQQKKNANKQKRQQQNQQRLQQQQLQPQQPYQYQ
jgi:outer membrane protein OmpA-like peptidoglycan-associated protein